MTVAMPTARKPRSSGTVPSHTGRRPVSQPIVEPSAPLGSPVPWLVERWDPSKGGTLTLAHDAYVAAVARGLSGFVAGLQDDDAPYRVGFGSPEEVGASSFTSKDVVIGAGPLADTTLTEGQMLAILAGVAFHEVGHIRHGAAWNDLRLTLVKAAEPRLQSLVAMVTNVMNDVRLEHEMRAAFPGFGEALDAAYWWVCHRLTGKGLKSLDVTSIVGRAAAFADGLRYTFLHDWAGHEDIRDWTQDFAARLEETTDEAAYRLLYEEAMAYIIGTPEPADPEDPEGPGEEPGGDPGGTPKGGDGGTAVEDPEDDSGEPKGGAEPGDDDDEPGDAPSGSGDEPGEPGDDDDEPGSGAEGTEGEDGEDGGDDGDGEDGTEGPGAGDDGGDEPGTLDGIPIDRPSDGAGGEPADKDIPESGAEGPEDEHGITFDHGDDSVPESAPDEEPVDMSEVEHGTCPMHAIVTGTEAHVQSRVIAHGSAVKSAPRVRRITSHVDGRLMQRNVTEVRFSDSKQGRARGTGGLDNAFAAPSVQSVDGTPDDSDRATAVTEGEGILGLMRRAGSDAKTMKTFVPLPRDTNAERMLAGVMASSRTAIGAPERTQRTGRFDKSAARRIASYDYRVFASHVSRTFEKVRFTILIDASGSMAAPATFGGKTTKVVDAIKVATDIAGAVETLPWASGEVWAHSSARGTWVCPLWKSGQPLEYIRDILRLDMGGNEDGYAVAYVAEELLASLAPKERGVLIVVSDGLPAYGYGEEHTREVVNGYRARGLRVVSVALGHDISKDAQRTMYGQDVVAYDANVSVFTQRMAKVIGTSI
jgi:hypothetical protein